MQPSFLIISTYYPEFLTELYDRDPALARLGSDEQKQRLLNTAFGVRDAYAYGLRAAGCEAHDVIVNADVMQAQWAAEHDLRPSGNIHDQRRQIVAAQIDHYRPDVLYVFEWCPLGDAFLADVKPRVRLLAGQIGSSLPGNRTFAAYDVMLSCWPPIVSHFRGEGIAAEPLRLAFDDRVLEHIDAGPAEYPVTFVGGFAPAHTARVPWLERLLEDLDIAIFGYGIERVPANSSIHQHYRGSAWGWRMYEILQRSRLTLHLQATIDVRGTTSDDFAAAMRLYEATGVGTCLVTAWKQNMRELFEPGREVVTYGQDDECVERIRHLLEHEDERAAIARAGQQRTLREHTYTQRMRELSEILKKRI